MITSTFRKSFILALGLVATSVVMAAAKPSYIGWAQEAHADYSDEVFRNHLKEQKKYGANLVWIGHNNPGFVDKNKAEPGLSFAVYEAIQDEKSPLHGDAVAQAAAVKRLLNAARQEGMKVVLAIGYQIQMGPVWNERHPEALRTDHEGKIWTAGGPSASFLSAAYQHDIQDFYHWVYKEWVIPYKDVLLMLNLADEPHGGDYSSAAETAFKAETGFTWKEAGRTEAGIMKKGKFQNQYIANYAWWSANAWKTIDPSVRVTMSFCGSHGRFINFEPSIWALFSQTPENFDITFDAFLIDNQPGDPIDGKHVSALAIFLRQVGELSQRHHKRVWLWPEANNWILSQWSPVKGNISDALFGVTLLRNMSAAAGIQLGGLAVWNLDVKEQGLFRDTHELTYDPQRMFDVISSDFKTAADPVRLRHDLLVWIPESEANHLMGRKEYDYADRIYLLDVYAGLLERGIIPHMTSDDEPVLDGVKTLFLISKYSPFLTPEAYQKLERFVRRGRTLICNYPVLQPDSSFQKFCLWTRFYWNALLSTVLRRPGSLEISWGDGKIIYIFGKMNEKRRNIVHDIPAEVIKDLTGDSALPIESGDERGLLAFPQEKNWLFYNTNPKLTTVTLRPKSRATLVVPNGTYTPVENDASHVTLPHGAWLILPN